MPVGGMYYHPGGFIDYHQVVVFVNDVQGDIFRYDLDFPTGIGHDDRYDIFGFYLITRFDSLPVYQNISGIGSFLNFCAGSIRQT